METLWLGAWCVATILGWVRLREHLDMTQRRWRLVEALVVLLVSGVLGYLVWHHPEAAYQPVAP